MSIESSNYIKFLAIRVSRNGEIDDDLEIISTEFDVIEQSSPSPDKPRLSIRDGKRFLLDDNTRRILTRGIIIIGSAFIIFSGILLIVSLSMSHDIDNVGKLIKFVGV